MFFVFGPSGQMYRGGPENLSQIAAVRRVDRPQALRTRTLDLDQDTAPPRRPSRANVRQWSTCVCRTLWPPTSRPGKAPRSGVSP